MDDIKKFDGLKAAAEMLAHLDTAAREKLLANVAERDSALADQLQKQMFVFEDLVHLPPSDLQLVLKEISQTRLALALRNVPEEVKNKLFENMSVRGGESLREEINSQGPRRVSDVESAQSEVIKIAKRLERDGKIKFRP